MVGSHATPMSVRQTTEPTPASAPTRCSTSMMKYGAWWHSGEVKRRSTSTWSPRISTPRSRPMSKIDRGTPVAALHGSTIPSNAACTASTVVIRPSRPSGWWHTARACPRRAVW